MRRSTIRRPRPARAGDHIPAVFANSVPSVPSRTNLRPMAVLGFPGVKQAQADIGPVMTELGIQPEGGTVVYTRMISIDDADDLCLRESFGIDDLPALVISEHTDAVPLLQFHQGPERPSFCVVDDVSIGQPGTRLATTTRNLAEVLGACTSEELDVAVRNRTFRMLVWKASARSGKALRYITNIHIRLGTGAGSVALSFDDAGWATDAARQSGAFMGAEH